MNWAADSKELNLHLRELVPEQSRPLFDYYVRGLTSSSHMDCEMQGVEKEGTLLIACHVEVPDEKLPRLLQSLLMSFHSFIQMRREAKARGGSFTSQFLWDNKRGVQIGPNVLQRKESTRAVVSLTPEELVRRKLGAISIGGSEHQDRLDAIITLGLIGIRPEE